MNRDLSRRLTTIGHRHRRAALGLVGLAVIGGAVAGPAVAYAAPAAVAVVPAETSVAPYTPFEKALPHDFQFQPNDYYCDPAATRIAITAGGRAAPSQDDLARLLGTTVNGTDSSFDTTRVLNGVFGAGVYQTRSIPGDAATAAEMDRLRLDVVAAVSNGRAVVANVIGSTVDISGRWHSFLGGHYLTVVGYGEGGTTMKVADPADIEGGGSYWISTLNLAHWIASRGYSA